MARIPSCLKPYQNNTLLKFPFRTQLPIQFIFFFYLSPVMISPLCKGFDIECSEDGWLNEDTTSFTDRWFVFNINVSQRYLQTDPLMIRPRCTSQWNGLWRHPRKKLKRDKTIFQDCEASLSGNYSCI